MVYKQEGNGMGWDGRGDRVGVGVPGLRANLTADCGISAYILESEDKAYCVMKYDMLRRS
jgi:hypothetical protein